MNPDELTLPQTAVEMESLGPCLKMLARLLVPSEAFGMHRTGRGSRGEGAGGRPGRGWGGQKGQGEAAGEGEGVHGAAGEGAKAESGVLVYRAMFKKVDECRVPGGRQMWTSVGYTLQSQHPQHLSTLP
ncbi:unnamed protein product [Boreogadus saida]